MKIYSTYYSSPIGTLKIQCSSEHIHCILFCEAKEEQSKSPHLLLQQCSTQLDEYFSGKRAAFNLPLQQKGTLFQQKIWTLLSDIPFGKTITYHQLAVQYGEIKAIRAVASANGKNNLAIVVPCHRVIGSNQSLTGYAGGLWRKKWLLEHEAKHHIGVEQLNLIF